MLLGAVEFEKIANVWQLRNWTSGVATSGAFGQPPTIEFRRLGPQEYGFATTNSAGGQGGLEIHYAIYWAAESSVPLVLSAQTQSESSPFALGPDEDVPTRLKCRQENYSFAPLHSVTNGLFDLSVRFEMGTRYAPNQRGAPNPCEIPISQSRDYRSATTRARFESGRYCLISAISGTTPQLPLCAPESPAIP